jgi:hypothetical protein
LAAFSLVKSNIFRFVDSLPKAVAKSASKFFLIKGEDDLGIVHLWRLLALPIYNPKAQACVVYAPVGRVADGHFFRGDFVPPYKLRMQVCSSRFSTSSCEAFRSIFFETSDELAARMVKSGAKSWSLVPLDTHICTEADSLLYVVVTGHGAVIDLTVTKQKEAAAHAGQATWMLWQRLQRTHKRTAGDASTSRASGSADPAPDVLRDADAVPLAVLEALGDEDGSSFLGEGVFAEGLLEELGAGHAAEAFDEWLAGELDEIIEEEAAEATAGVGDEVALGGFDESLAGAVPEGPDGSTSIAVASVDVAGPAQDLVLAMDAANAYVNGSEGAAASSSSDLPGLAMMHIEPGSEVSPDGKLAVSPLGYVRCCRPPHDGVNTIGLVSTSRNLKTMFASCHMHVACDIKVGVVTAPCSRMRLAEWLAVGVRPPEGTARQARKELGVPHRLLWSRHGPVGHFDGQ